MRIVVEGESALAAPFGPRRKVLCTHKDIKEGSFDAKKVFFYS